MKKLNHSLKFNKNFSQLTSWPANLKRMKSRISLNKLQSIFHKWANNEFAIGWNAARQTHSIHNSLWSRLNFYPSRNGEPIGCKINSNLINLLFLLRCLKLFALAEASGNSIKINLANLCRTAMIVRKKSSRYFIGLIKHWTSLTLLLLLLWLRMVKQFKSR